DRLRLRSHPAAERLPACEKRQLPLPSGHHRFAHARVKHRRGIDPLPAHFHVRKLVPQSRYAFGRERITQFLQERMPHPRARSVRQHVERPRSLRLLQDHFSFPASRDSAAVRSGTSVSTGASGSSFNLRIRAGAVLSVNFAGSSLPFTSLHLSGTETVAPGTGRALNGPAIVLPWPFW